MLTIRDGHFYDGPNRFIGWGANVSTWALISGTRSDIRAMFHRMVDAGCNCVRFHHLDSLNFPGVFSGLQSSDLNPLSRPFGTTTLNENYARAIDEALIDCRDVGLKVWLDLWNRRQLTGVDLDRHKQNGNGRVESLFTNPVGTSKAGELRSYFFVFPELQDDVYRFCETMLSRINSVTGVPYVDDPTIGWFLIANEHDFVRHSQHFWPKTPIGTGLSAEYHRAWVDLWRSWSEKNNPADASKQMTERFKIDIETDVYSRLKKRLIDRFPQLASRPLVTHSLWGDTPWSGLSSVASTAGATDLHIYPDLASGINVMTQRADPLWMPTALSYIAGNHLAHQPITISEWGPVNQRGTKRLPPADCVDACRYMGHACIAQDVDAAFLFAWQQAHSKIEWSKTDPYGLGTDVEFVRAFRENAEIVRAPRESRAETTIVLGAREMCGQKLNETGGFHQPSAWTESYIREAASSGRLVKIRISA